MNKFTLMNKMGLIAKNREEIKNIKGTEIYVNFTRYIF